jgi:hypothetical protein
MTMVERVSKMSQIAWRHLWRPLRKKDDFGFKLRHTNLANRVVGTSLFLLKEDKKRKPFFCKWAKVQLRVNILAFIIMQSRWRRRKEEAFDIRTQSYKTNYKFFWNTVKLCYYEFYWTVSIFPLLPCHHYNSKDSWNKLTFWTKNITNFVL